MGPDIAGRPDTALVPPAAPAEHSPRATGARRDGPSPAPRGRTRRALGSRGGRRGGRRRPSPAGARAQGVAVGLAVVLLVAGCADDGRAMAEPGPDQTTTTDPTAVGAGGTADSSGTTVAVTLSSPSFGQGQPIPAQFTCTGGNITPALSWSSIPMGTAELALVLRNVDDTGFLQWVVAGLPAQSGGIAEGALPAGAVQALNETGSTGYVGPCPEGGTQHYEFTLYAITEPIGLAAETPARQALEQIESAPQAASAVLSVTATP